MVFPNLVSTIKTIKLNLLPDYNCDVDVSCWHSWNAWYKCDFPCFCGHLAEVLVVADVHAVHALLIRDEEASVLKLFAELQMLSALLLIIYIWFHKSDQ